MKRRVLHYLNGMRRREEEVIEEVPLVVYVNGRRYGTIFRTPGEEEALLVGMCFTEGLIRERRDVLSVDVREDIARVEIAGEYRGREERDLQEILREIGMNSLLPHKPEGKEIVVGQLLKCLREMESIQGLREKTEAAHAVMLFSYDLEPISASEDVGRHNAFDKAIGKAMLHDKLEDAFVATLSSRISFEMAKKAAMAGIRIVVGVSRPTSLAILLGDQLRMTIVSLAKEGGVTVYSAQERIRGPD